MHTIKKILLYLILLFPCIVVAQEFRLLCNGEEKKFTTDDKSSERISKKIISAEVFENGMRIDGEWFDNNIDITDDYNLERSFSKTNERIDGSRRFITSSFIEGYKIQTTKIDIVKIDLINSKLSLNHEFNRRDVTEDKEKEFYSFEKTFNGTCRKVE